MSLKQRQPQDRDTFQHATMNARERATWAPPYQTPIHGQVDGEPVRILQIGDLPGHSPVYLCVDEDGFSAPIALNEVQITDGAFLPLVTPQTNRNRTRQTTNQ
jgi:hypothetical protein